ncbi:hypothetical protein G7Y89_g3423 [Cudoniella acicularis]|uniref:Uncharacterized protein n=1 Tax=Cudoniella acicularis TaxID=354080 RepID=A0A8H4RS94_9HELO|nr:hypothetical protein G7Y89_g3423 [Cudoniella acicularis]
MAHSLKATCAYELCPVASIHLLVSWSTKFLIDWLGLFEIVAYKRSTLSPNASKSNRLANRPALDMTHLSSKFGLQSDLVYACASFGFCRGIGASTFKSTVSSLSLNLSKVSLVLSSRFLNRRRLSL